MRNTTSQLAIAAVLASGMIGPALADVTVLVEVSKDKTINVDEFVSITKTVSISAVFVLDLDGAAEAQALANIRNEDNNVTYNGADTPIDVDFSAVFDDSVLTNSGITGVNQDAGTNAKQGNVVAVGIVDSRNAFAGAQAEADQVNARNTVLEGDQDPFSTAGPPFPNPLIVANTAVYEAEITDSINGGPGPSGIIGVNQNAGNNNSQLNMVALAAGVELDPQNEEGANPDVTAALSEAALGQSNVGLGTIDSQFSVRETGTYKTASITGSLSDHRGGIIGANQAAGNNANQGNLVSIAASVRF